MSDLLVLDASAALAILLNEPSGAQVEAIARSSARIGSRTVVPSHFWLEVVNVLVRRYRVAASAVVEGLRSLDALELETLTMDRPQVLLAVDRMWTHGLSACDAQYLALAERLDATLLTLDERLGQAAPDRVLPRRSTRLAETPVPYGVSPAEVWAKNGAWLAELRAEALRG